MTGSGPFAGRRCSTKRASHPRSAICRAGTPVSHAGPQLVQRREEVGPVLPVAPERTSLPRRRGNLAEALFGDSLLTSPHPLRTVR
jgi:hypothetical protein